MTRLPADLLPALPSSVDPARHVPTLPSWYPLDRRPSDDDPHPAPYTEPQRAELRRRKAIAEACAGPYDGQQLAVAFADGERPPAEFVPFNAQHVRYVIDPAASTPYRLRYRYDPNSAIHPQLMAAVTAAYAEAGPDYTLLSREESPDERTVPTL